MVVAGAADALPKSPPTAGFAVVGGAPAGVVDPSPANIGFAGVTAGKRLPPEPAVVVATGAAAAVVPKPPKLGVVLPDAVAAGAVEVPGAVVKLKLPPAVVVAGAAAVPPLPNRPPVVDEAPPKVGFAAPSVEEPPKPEKRPPLADGAADPAAEVAPGLANENDGAPPAAPAPPNSEGAAVVGVDELAEVDGAVKLKDMVDSLLKLKRGRRPGCINNKPQLSAVYGVMRCHDNGPPVASPGMLLEKMSMSCQRSKKTDGRWMQGVVVSSLVFFGDGPVDEGFSKDGKTNLVEYSGYLEVGMFAKRNEACRKELPLLRGRRWVKLLGQQKARQ